MRRLRDLAEHVRESTSPTSEDTRRYVGLEHLVSGDPSIAGWAPASSVRSSKFVFRPGDTLYGKLRPYLDKAAMAEFEGVASTDLLVLRPKEGVDPRFLTYTMHSRSVIEHAIATTVGVNHPRTSWSSLGELEVYAPLLEEQRRIARILSTIDQAKQSRQRVLVAARQTCDAMLKSLFAEMTPAATIGDIGVVKGGKRLPKGHAFASAETPYPYIRVVDLADGSVRTTDLRYLEPEDQARISRYVITQDDVYISIAGTIGLVGVIPAALDGANLTENAARIVIKDRTKIGNHFLAWYLRSPMGQAEIRVRTTKTSQPKLALMRIKDIPIPFPPLEEQQRTVQILSTIHGFCEAVRREVEALDKVFHATMKSLLEPTP